MNKIDVSIIKKFEEFFDIAETVDSVKVFKKEFYAVHKKDNSLYLRKDGTVESGVGRNRENCGIFSSISDLIIAINNWKDFNKVN